MSTIDLNVKGMTCNHCKMAVEKAVKGLGGVQDAVVNLEQGTVKVSFDEGKVKIQAIESAITEEGYEVVK